MDEDSTKDLGQVIRIDDERVRDYLRNVVRGSVEETLNAMLEAEAEQLCNAGRYERTEGRRDRRCGTFRAGASSAPSATRTAAKGDGAPLLTVTPGIEPSRACRRHR